MEGMTPFVLLGTRGQVEGRKFLVSVEVGGMIPTVPRSGRKMKTGQVRVTNLMGRTRNGEVVTSRQVRGVLKWG